MASVEAEAPGPGAHRRQHRPVVDHREERLCHGRGVTSRDRIDGELTDVEARVAEHRGDAHAIALVATRAEQLRGAVTEREQRVREQRSGSRQRALYGALREELERQARGLGLPGEHAQTRC